MNLLESKKMKQNIKYTIVYVVILCGCYKAPDIKESISSYDYEYLKGYNAAVAQFGINNEDMYVDLSNKKVISYTSSENDVKGYVDGYHRALDIISNRNNPSCPHIH